MQIVMPKLGLTMTEGALVRWLKAAGQTVKQGDILFEFESDKSLLEYEAPADGVLAEILISAGETVPCGTPVAVLATAVSQPVVAPSQPTIQPSNLPSVATNQPTIQPSNLPSVATNHPFIRLTNQPTIQPATHLPDRLILATPAAKRLAREAGIDLAMMTGRGPQGRIQLADVEQAIKEAATAEPLPSKTGTPLAKRLAGELGLDWTQLAGSGPGGRVVKEDVLQAVQGAPASEPALAPQAGIPVPVDVQPLAGVRGVIARRMRESAFTAPHVTLFTEADATNLVAARAQLNAELGGAVKISYNALLLAIVARTLIEHPALNSCLVGEEIHLYREIHLALAVDTERGLLAPVVRRADQLNLVEIEQTLDALIGRALAGQSSPDELSGGTFTITNLGMYEIDGFTPIINQPQAAILGCGRIQAKPAVIEDKVAVRQMMTLSLSFDHRLVDGGPAARFLQRVKQLVERPFALVIPN